MQLGEELQQYLTRCQSIPVIFRIPQYALLSSKFDQYKPVPQRSSKQETKIYCELMYILIPNAPGTGGGVGTIFD